MYSNSLIQVLVQKKDRVFFELKFECAALVMKLTLIKIFFYRTLKETFDQVITVWTSNNALNRNKKEHCTVTTAVIGR